MAVAVAAAVAGARLRITVGKSGEILSKRAQRFRQNQHNAQDLFEQHGQVNEVRLMMDRMTGKSRGFAFVTMNDNAQANAAMSALNGQEFNGRALTVNEARPREERPRPGGGGGRRPYANNRR